MKRRILITVMILVICMAFSACGNSGDNTPTPSPSPTIDVLPKAERFETIDDFVRRLAENQNGVYSAAGNRNFDHIYELVNFPKNAKLNIVLRENSYSFGYQIDGNNDPKTGAVSMTVDFYFYDKSGAVELFDTDNLKTMAENDKDYAYFENRDILFMAYPNDAGENVGKLFLFPYEGHRVKMYMPNWYYDELIAAGKNPFEICVVG
ncbi:MAG: hypothetical protein RR327_05745 [Clostridia bacterium]